MATVAFLSPLPPAETGIATYAAAVLGGLQETGFTSLHDVQPVWPIPPDIDERVRASDVAVYQLGNNVEFHGAIYRTAVWHPGVVVIHDLALDGLMYGLGVERSPLAEPARAEAIAAAPPGAELEYPLGVPWCAQVVRRARAVIVHSYYAREYLRRIGCRTPIVVAPHPLVEAEDQIDRARARGAALRAQVCGRDQMVVGIAGDLNASKGIEELLEALGHVRPSVRVVLVGRMTPHWDVRSVLRHSGVSERVTVVPNAPDDDFLAWLSAFDILVNLRNPHRGETSGSLIRALHVGVPTIVSAVGTYLEVPEDVVVRVPPGPPDPAALAAAIERLAADAGARAAIGARARAYAREEFAPRATASAYAVAIEGALALRADPSRAALARWASALRAEGVRPRDVRRGFGLRYAEALAELSGAE
jgi:glycosyltransferase involved in cell wall biosynthesis